MAYWSLLPASYFEMFSRLFGMISNKCFYWYILITRIGKIICFSQATQNFAPSTIGQRCEGAKLRGRRSDGAKTPKRWKKTRSYFALSPSQILAFAHALSFLYLLAFAVGSCHYACVAWNQRQIHIVVFTLIF